MAYELVRETLRRFEAGDREDWRSSLAEDVVWDMTGDDAGIFGRFHGHRGVEDFFTQWLGAWEDYSVENTELIDAGDSVVVVFRQHGRGRGAAWRSIGTSTACTTCATAGSSATASSRAGTRRSRRRT